MARMTQQEFDQLLASHIRGGEDLRHSKALPPKKIPNPALANMTPAQAILAKEAGMDTIMVSPQRWQGVDTLIEAYQNDDGSWEVQQESQDKPTISSTSSVGPAQRALAEAKAQAEKDQRDWNRTHGPGTVDPVTGEPGRGSGLDETHAERTKREFEAQDQAGQQETREAARRAELRAIDAQRLQAEQQAEQNRLARDRLDFDKDKDLRPQLAGTPTDTTRNIGVWDPASQTLRSVENPMYDAAKVEAARLKDQLSTGIALNQITAQQAAQQYKQWWDTNVELPFKQSAEVRARATEQREALAAEDRRKQFASDFSLRQNTLGFNAGDAAVKNEISLLPYRAGPTEAAEMSSAITSLGQGGKIAGPDAGAGINFTPEAFQFDRPDFDKIAQKATKNALKGITKYTPEGKFSQGDYSGISMPSGQGAPSSTGGGIDLSTLWNQYLQNGVAPYQGPEDDAKG